MFFFKIPVSATMNTVLRNIEFFSGDCLVESLDTIDDAFNDSVYDWGSYFVHHFAPVGVQELLDRLS